MKNEFKYLGVVTSIFIAAVFGIGGMSNIENGRYAEGGGVLVVSALFLILAVLIFNRAQGKRKLTQLSSDKPLPQKSYPRNLSKPETKVVKLIYLAVDHVDEGDIEAGKILVKQALKAVTEIESDYQVQWEKDLAMIQEVILDLEAKTKEG